MQDENILVWLPSPLGDAVLCTPALRAIRRHFKSSKISFLANRVVRQILSPGTFNDNWLELQNKRVFFAVKMLRNHKFTRAILFKNSFGSALTVFLAGIPQRIGYAREGRGIFLTDKLFPQRLPDGRYQPLSMVDYYMEIAKYLGAETSSRKLELAVDPQDKQTLLNKLPEIIGNVGPLIIIVPGGAFGPSKYWPPERFAQTADRLASDYNATIVISAASNPAEKQIAKKICDSAGRKLVNLAENPVSLGELKTLFSIADLVISNDTGPRHIAIALGRKIITLFGPNNPIWTDTGYENEILIISQAHCAPCDKPICKKPEHLCMEAITVEMVCEAARKLLEKN